ncbi:MAG: 2,3-bisphosphoglycerate-independent phosphoglycerate mutase [Defluviitaleaceae bacterium]|nr:2,3-bisphosphoglycerate-independent phosphoglycerate mutase [Defluviitaleaceae bacterium]
MILDGFGLSTDKDNNAIHLAETPHIDWLFEKFPMQHGAASGMDVGLPDGQMGNSEVGHTNIGAGRVVYQELTRITKAIEDGDFFQNEALLGAIENAKTNNTALHFMGLLSDGGVHSHNGHLYGLLELAKRNGVTNVYVHPFLDGRDTPPTSAIGFVKELEAKMEEIGVGKISTLCGRYYAMDRDNRWERVELAYNALTQGTGNTAVSAVEALEKSYAEGINDEFVVPTVIDPSGTVKAKDSVVFFNFRPDRAREITRAFCDPNFAEFPRKGLLPLYYAVFTDYDPTVTGKHVAFYAQSMDNTLGQYISGKGLTQLRLAETTKYAHVTYFFNGGVEAPYPNEDRILVDTPEVATFDLKPEMSAEGITDRLVEAIHAQKYDLIVINYANPDMVGHSGNMEATIKAVETVDTCVARAMTAMLETGTRMFLCADHGNADKMHELDTGEAFTAHTTNPVPFALFNIPGYGLAPGGRLADIAPTLLELLGLPKPPEMTGKSLLIKL